MITLIIIAVCVALYFIGGQKWAHTLFRDIGCGICITALAWLALGWSWLFLAIVPIVWGGCSIGDHGKLYWALHGFVISLCLLPFAWATNDWPCQILASAVVTVGTYLASRFFNKFGIDVILRGLFYATIPLWFLIRFQ